MRYFSDRTSSAIKLGHWLPDSLTSFNSVHFQTGPNDLRYKSRGVSVEHLESDKRLKIWKQKFVVENIFPLHLCLISISAKIRSLNIFSACCARKSKLTDCPRRFEKPFRPRIMPRSAICSRVRTKLKTGTKDMFGQQFYLWDGLWDTLNCNINSGAKDEWNICRK